MKPHILLFGACIPHVFAEPIPLADVAIGAFAPPPPVLAGPLEPVKPMEATPPEFESCHNAEAVLQGLGIGLSNAQLADLDERRFLLIPIEDTALAQALPESEDDEQWAFTMDEMLAAFDRLGGDADPSFRNSQNARLINPDLILHIWHRGFARALEHIEQRRLHAILTGFLEGVLQNTRELRTVAGDDALATRLAWTEARFAAPWVLLGPPAPPHVEPWEQDNTPAPPAYSESITTRLAEASAGLPEEIAAALKSEIEAILAAEDMAPSPLFGMYAPDKPADYTQFKPRSHYTKSDTLGGYFRAMMYLGRYGFEFVTSESYGDAALAAMAMARTTAAGARPLNAWKQLMEITSFFAGQSDDITYTEFRNWIADTLGSATLDPAEAIAEGTATALAANLAELRPPLIVSSVHADPLTSPDADPPAFRVFGQRFSWDARILDRFTRDSPEAMPSLPTALMVPAAFGDPHGEKLVREKLAGNPTHLATFDARLPEIRKEIAAVTEEAWFSSMAAKQLHVISTLARPRGDTFPAFMQGGAFAAKNLESQLGSFTQLKHDTVLYAKQVYAEAGEGGLDDQLPPVVKGLVQPDLPFWREMERLARFAADGFARHQLFPDAAEEFSRFRYFATQVASLREIAEKHASGTPLTDDDWETIRTIDFTEMMRPMAAYDEPAPGEGKNALVTDIATDAATGRILFQALGRPFVMLALVGGNDGDRMVAGLAYNHHEFSRPLSDGRMNNEEWRAGIYRPDPGPIERADWKAPVTRPEPPNKD